MGDFLSQAGSKVANLVFIYTLLRNSLPSRAWNYVDYYFDRVKSWFDKDMTTTFEEFPYSDSGYCGRSQVYNNVEAYLRDLVLLYARGLKAKPGTGAEPIDLSMDDYGTVSDEFNGNIKLKWFLDKKVCESKGIYSRLEAKRSYILTFDRRHRSVILGQYMHHVNQEGKRIRKQNKFQKIYTNSREDRGSWGYNSFEHPATFDTLGMDPIKKQKIINDLDAFTKGEEYYKKIGKAWKRGYLLYGPPGTGKSTMIAAMANYLHYDVYMVELTAIQDNTQLKKLLDETSKKSLIVIEDIDCSIDLTGKRAEKKQQEPTKESGNGTAEKGDKKEVSSRPNNKLTLSGVLNCIDGLSSGCYKERIFVFTTNHVDKLDPALIRRDRMDLHIEMSYCCFESFKVLAKNYQNLDWHPWFDKIRVLLEEVDIAPADVAKNLMPKCPGLDNDGEVALESLISALEQAKEAARLKAEEQQNQLTKKSSDGDDDQDKQEQEQAVADENESIDQNDEALDDHDESSDDDNDESSDDDNDDDDEEEEEEEVD